MRLRLFARRAAAAAVVFSALVPAMAAAQVTDAAREAGQHFRRGVELYSEANYAGALVEFKRAYALASSSTALYDIGETQFQLQDYAGALQTFKKFLAEFGPGENHHAEVEANVQVLATRVGHVRITTIPSGAEVAVDDETVGITPLAEPVLVSVGHRKVVASMSGREPVTRYVDVAAGDEASVIVPLSERAPAVVAPSRTEERPAVSVVRGPPMHVSAGVLAAGWVTTGVLAIAAGTFGILAIRESNELSQVRGQLQPAGPDANAVPTHDANLTVTFSAIADSLTAAAIVTGGVSLYLTLASATSSRGPTVGATRLTFGPASARFETYF